VWTVSNPVGFSFSPFTDEAMVVTSDGTDAYLSLYLDAGTWNVGGQVTQPNGHPQLPGPPQMLTRGTLKGHFFIPELDAIRQFAWGPDGGLTDVSKTTIPMNNSGEIIGVFGVAP
jgi:hypothetical protein